MEPRPGPAYDPSTVVLGGRREARTPMRILLLAPLALFAIASSQPAPHRSNGSFRPARLFGRDKTAAP